MKHPLLKKSIYICSIILLIYSVVGGAFLYGNQWKQAIQSIVAEIPSMLQVERKPIPAATSKTTESNQNRALPPLNRILSPVYEVEGFLNEKTKEINATMTVEFLNPKQPYIPFYLYEYKSYSFQIKRITYNSQSVPYTLSERTLKIENPESESETIELQIEYSVPVPRQGTRFGVKDNVWLLTNWYPQLAVLSREGQWMFPPVPKGYGDPFYYQYGDYTVHLTSPSSFRWVSSGERSDEEVKDRNLIRRTWKAKGVLGFALVGSPNFNVQTVNISGGTSIEIALVDVTKMDKIMNLVKQTAEFYQKQFGPLPYKRVALAETGFQTTFAMEYPNLAIYSRDLYQDDRIYRWIPHEIAHLWWYNSVATWEPIYGWIDEGFSEYAYYSYMRERWNGTKQDIFNHVKKDGRSLAEKYPSSFLNRGLKEFQNKEEWNLMWYKKSVLLLKELEKQIGKDPFLLFLKSVQQTYPKQVIGPAHLDQVLSDVMGKKVDYFKKNGALRNKEGIYPLQ